MEDKNILNFDYKEILKNNYKIIISVIIFLIGLLILFNSVKLSQQGAISYIKRDNNAMDTYRFIMCEVKQMIKYTSIGIVLSIIGGFASIKGLYNK